MCWGTVQQVKAVGIAERLSQKALTQVHKAPIIPLRARRKEGTWVRLSETGKSGCLGSLTGQAAPQLRGLLS